MIAPDMATMLAFVFTDAALSAPILKTLLRAETETSFNSITVDGDRSHQRLRAAFRDGPSATCRRSPTRKIRASPISAPRCRACWRDLAIQIVRDGEGATKLVTLNVEGAASDASAKLIARTICESPLVKTAIAGEDANWGRIVAAVGPRRSADEARACSPCASATSGPRATAWLPPDYDEATMSAYMKRPELEISVVVGAGAGRARMYTCDLTKRYVEINGDYRS